MESTNPKKKWKPRPAKHRSPNAHSRPASQSSPTTAKVDNIETFHMPSITDAKVNDFLQQVTIYGSISAACGRARVPRSTVMEYLSKGRRALQAGTDAEPESKHFAAFTQATHAAGDQWEANTLDQLNDATTNARIKALTFLLERLRADTYRPQLETVNDEASALMAALATRGKLAEERESAAAQTRTSSHAPARGKWLAFDRLPPSLLMLPESSPPADAEPRDGAGQPSPSQNSAHDT